MDRTGNQHRFPGVSRNLWPLLLPCIAGCSPYVEIGGAYFPGWLLALLLGSLAATGLRLALVRKRIDSFIEPRALAWPSAIVALSALFWLILFSR